MPPDTNYPMFFPAPDGRAVRVRGPVQTVTHDDGRTTMRQLYIRTTKVMAFATKAGLHLNCACGADTVTALEAGQ